jgi:hypothetical protein
MRQTIIETPIGISPSGLLEKIKTAWKCPEYMVYNNWCSALVIILKSHFVL